VATSKNFGLYTVWEGIVHSHLSISQSRSAMDRDSGEPDTHDPAVVSSQYLTVQKKDESFQIFAIWEICLNTVTVVAVVRYEGCRVGYLVDVRVVGV
jgi:hypothetical protein